MKSFPLADAYRGKRVFVTGHTGFKGSWLCLWLELLGAKVRGFALEPPTEPAMFDLCDVARGLESRIGDIRDADMLTSEILDFQPDVILHLAAQPIVRQSYRDPMETLTTNVVGTAHVLEAARKLDGRCALIVVTSDKCYENEEWVWGYRESDPMGGKDPYSMSKGAAELVVNSWRRSFFDGQDQQVRLASARAGNVLGGGDWAADRIVTDVVGAFARGETVRLRNPQSIRPWQHVLEPLGGYLLLGARLLEDDGADLAEGWNFGPSRRDVTEVEQIVALIAESWEGDCRWTADEGVHAPEANLLSLNIDKAISRLGWTPTWPLPTLVEQLVEWYQAWHRGDTDLRLLSLKQIRLFEADAGWIDG